MGQGTTLGIPGGRSGNARPLDSRRENGDRPTLGVSGWGNWSASIPTVMIPLGFPEGDRATRDLRIPGGKTAIARPWAFPDGEIGPRPSTPIPSTSIRGSPSATPKALCPPSIARPRSEWGHDPFGVPGRGTIGPSTINGAVAFCESKPWETHESGMSGTCHAQLSITWCIEMGGVECFSNRYRRPGCLWISWIGRRVRCIGAS